MDGNAESVGNSQKTAQAGVTARAFEVGDIGSRKLASLGQYLLGPALVFAAELDVAGQAVADLIFGLGFHGAYQIRLNEYSVSHERQPETVNNDRSNLATERITKYSRNHGNGRKEREKAGELQMSDFLFQSAVVKTVGFADGPVAEKNIGKPIRLERAAADMNGTLRRPMRLRLTGYSGVPSHDRLIEATMEMSRNEAYAFSEWLDAVVTQSPPKRGSKKQEKKDP